MTPMTRPETERLVDDIAHRICEHFDCVQILASRLKPDGSTEIFRRGAGNWFARKGMMHDYLETVSASDSAEMIAEQLRPPED